MKSIILLLISVIAFTYVLFGGEEEHDDHRHTHSHEIGIVNAPVYFLNEKELSYAFHVHYTYFLPQSPIGVGLGFEKIFDEHSHNALTVNFNYELFEHLNIDVAPGIMFEGSAIGDSRFTIHFETFYEFEIGDFHIGPSAEFAYDPEDLHLSMGLHLGFVF
jgi:hypothetical protein